MTIERNLNVSNLQNNCRIWKKTEGFVGEFEKCSKSLKVNKLEYIWQVQVPTTGKTRCWKTVKQSEDPRCHVPVTGFGHPHVVMLNDYLYTLQIELL